MLLGPASTEASDLVDGAYPARFSADPAVAALAVVLRRRHPGTSFALSLVRWIS